MGEEDGTVQFDDYLVEVVCQTQLPDDVIVDKSTFRVAGVSEDTAVHGLLQGLEQLDQIHDAAVSEVWQDHE